MAHIQVNGTSLWVEDTGGAAPAIVFSHSLFFDHGMFVHQAEAFATTHRVIRYDHRGQGRSAPALDGRLDMDALSGDAAALIEALGAGPCHFVGNSLGGFVALRLAIRRPDLLRSATILGSSAEAEHRVAEFTPLIEAMRQDGIGPHIDTIMYIMFGDTFLADPARHAERAHWRGKIAGLPAGIADSAHEVVHRAAVLSELQGCTVPLLAISGGEDHAYGPAEANNAARAARGRHVSIGDAGHSVALERPEAANAALRAHIERTAARTNQPWAA